MPEPRLRDGAPHAGAGPVDVPDGGTNDVTLPGASRETRDLLATYAKAVATVDELAAQAKWR